MGKVRVQKIAVGICFSILFFFMLTIVGRIFVRLVVVQRLRVEDNIFVNALFFDQKHLTNVNNGGTFLMNEEGEVVLRNSIDWSIEYPFDESETDFIEDTNRNHILASWESRIAPAIEKVTTYATSFLFGRQYLVYALNSAEKIAGWNIVALNEYNGVIRLEDGRLVEYLAQQDVTENVEAVVGLNKFCSQCGSDFLYVQSPYEICKYDTNVSGVLDYSNQNADSLLEGLAEAGVKCLDMRECMHEEGMDHADAFYRTDHHWKAETGLWAVGRLAEYLNMHNGFEINLSMLEKDQYEFEVYQKWFLGSKGRKVTLSQASPEDFTMIWPKYDTLMHYEIPENKLDVTGDFSITYDMTQIEKIDYYGLNPYSAYNHSNNAVTRIQNLKSDSQGKRILLIKDSFVNPAAPFLACVDGVAEVEVIDLRYFTGSTRNFIQKSGPDIVIVWYNPSKISKIDWQGHTGIFDFR